MERLHAKPNINQLPDKNVGWVESSETQHQSVTSRLGGDKNVGWVESSETQHQLVIR